MHFVLIYSFFFCLFNMCLIIWRFIDGWQTKKKCHSVTNLTYGKKDWSCIFDWNSNDRSLSVHHHITINKVIEIYANEIFFFCCLLFWITIKSWKLNESTMSLREWVSEKKTIQNNQLNLFITIDKRKKKNLSPKRMKMKKKVDRKKLCRCCCCCCWSKSV